MLLQSVLQCAGFNFSSLDDTNSVCYIQSIIIFAQPHVTLFQSPRSNQSIDLFAFDIVQFPYSSLDLALIGLDIDNEYQSVAVLNKFHRRLGCEWVLNDRMLVQRVLTGGTLSLVFWFARKLQGLWPVKVDLGVNSSPLLGDSLLEGL